MMGHMGIIRSIINIQDTLFVGTGNGLYRLSTDQLATRRISQYPSDGSVQLQRLKRNFMLSRRWLIRILVGFQGAAAGLVDIPLTDLGHSWTDITPTTLGP